MAILASFGHEGIPQSGLQAMYAETPFIGTTVGGIPEIVEDQVTGLLIEPKRPNAIAEAVVRSLQQPNREKMIRRAKEQVLANVLVDTMGNAVYDAISGAGTAPTKGRFFPKRPLQ